MQESQAMELAANFFGITGTASPLVGERNLNFRISGERGEFVLKIHTAAEAAELMVQAEALRALRSVPQLHEPELVPTLDGADHTILSDGRLARMLTWTPGQMWSSIEIHSHELLGSLGSAVARVDAALASVDFTSHASALNRPFGWNVMQTAELLDAIELIRDESLRSIVRMVLRRAVDETLPALRLLPEQLIHNDANDNNIVVNDDRVTSLIDFGDMIVAPRVAGLAVACAYVLQDSDDPWRAVLPVVRGYHLISPLSAEELALLPDLILTRIATSIVMAAKQGAASPENNYLQVSQDLFSTLLPRLEAAGTEYPWFRLRGTCGFEANPNSRHIREWLMSDGIPRADVVFPPLGQCPKIWLDWSKDNPDIPREWEQIEHLMHQAGAKLAIGHYCENREVYAGEAFSVTSPSRRTVHLGVDLFAPAGTPVHAAHDGEVYLFNDNNVYLDYGPVIILRHFTGDGVPFFTLYGHLSRPSLEGLYVGKPIKAGDRIAWMGEEHENVGWPPHTHFQLLTSLCGMGLDVHGVAPIGELATWRSISPNPNLLLRIEEGTDAHTAVPTESIAGDRKVAMSRALSLNFQTPLHIVRGQGAYLYDTHDRAYLDMVNNVAHVGHCNPRVIAAGQRQMAMLNTNTRYLHQNVTEFARSLAATMPDPLNVVFFTNSGSEANDLALRLARAHTKARGLLVLDHAYHGNLSSLVEISPYKFNGKGGLGQPGYVRTVPLPDSYKGIHRGEGAGLKYVDELVTQLNDLTEPLGAFISESIVSTAGQVTLCADFLAPAYERVRAVGGVCIADEVQIGMGRVGEHFWGFQLHGVVPDIVTVGKPLGNGHPVAAVVTTPEIAHSFLTGMEYFNTFGGNPVSAAIGQTVLDVVHDQGLMGHAHRVGEYLKAGVRALAGELEAIGDVRGHGLFLGVELVQNRDSQEPATKLTADLMEFARERGVFLSCDGPGNNVLKIKPPMVIGEAEVDLFLEVFAAGLRAAK